MKKLLLCCLTTFAMLQAQEEAALLAGLGQSLLLLEQATPQAPEASGIPEAPAFDAPPLDENWAKGPIDQTETKAAAGEMPSTTPSSRSPKAPTGPLPEGIFDELLEAAKKRKTFEEPIKKTPVAPAEAGLTVKRDVEAATNAFKTKYPNTTDWNQPKEVGEALNDLEGIMDTIAKFKSVGGKQDTAIQLLKNLCKALPESFIKFLETMNEARINSYPTSLKKREAFKKADPKALGNKRSLMSMKTDVLKMCAID